MVGVLYGILLAFVVFAVWEQFNNASLAVTSEAAQIVVSFRDTQTLPSPLQQQAQQALRTFVKEALSTEWNTHGELRAHTDPDLLNPVWEVYRQVQPATPFQAQEQADAQNRLHDLELQHHLFHLSGEATLPGIFWVILAIGAAVTLGFTYLFRLHRLGAQALITGALALLIGSSLFLIFSLNEPYTGVVHVSKQPLRHALQQFVALNNQAPLPQLPASQ